MRVLLVDDHAAIRKAVRATIEDCDGMEVVGEASNGEEAIEQTQKLRPDLIVTDVSMPVLDGLTAAEIIKRYYPETRILVFSMHKVAEFIDTAKRLGLNGYIPKEEDGPSLMNAFDAVRRNETYFPDSTTAASA